MARFRTLAIASIPLLVLGAGPAAGSGVQSTESIRAVAKRHLQGELAGSGEQREIEVGYVDRRLRMPRCEEALEGFIPPGGRRRGRTTVGVRCPGAQPWKLFIDAEVRIYDEVVVARRSLARGEPLTAADIDLVRRDVSRLPVGYFTEPGAVAGKQLARAMAAGSVITHRSVVLPASVRRGQRVVLLARTGGLEVRMEGQALANAGIGDVVQVRNRHSQRIVEGVVLANGVVDVPL